MVKVDLKGFNSLKTERLNDFFQNNVDGIAAIKMLDILTSNILWDSMDRFSRIEETLAPNVNLIRDKLCKEINVLSIPFQLNTKEV